MSLGRDGKCCKRAYLVSYPNHTMGSSRPPTSQPGRWGAPAKLVGGRQTPPTGIANLSSIQHERPEIVITTDFYLFQQLILTPESPITESSFAKPDGLFVRLGDVQNATKLICLMWKGSPQSIKASLSPHDFGHSLIHKSCKRLAAHLGYQKQTFNDIIKFHRSHQQFVWWHHAKVR